MPANKKHAEEIARLIYATEDDPAEVFGAGTKKEILDRIVKLVERKDTRYSYRFATVAMVDNNVAGVIIALPYSLIDDLEKNTSKALLKSLSFIDKLKFIWSDIKCLGIKEANDDEYYISNLSTSSEFRGRGIGTMLIKEAEKNARIYKLPKCSLLVSREREGAFRLYNKLEYRVCSEVEYPSGSYFRMTKNIASVQ
ncbi:MAG: GNAT family N-acetyltransferase [Clostridium sp.]